MSDAVGNAALVTGTISAGLVAGIFVAFSIAIQTDVPATLKSAREAFEDPWNRLHLVRTVALVAAFGCCVGAAISR